MTTPTTDCLTTEAGQLARTAATYAAGIPDAPSTTPQTDAAAVLVAQAARIMAAAREHDTVQQLTAAPTPAAPHVTYALAVRDALADANLAPSATDVVRRAGTLYIKVAWNAGHPALSARWPHGMTLEWAAVRGWGVVNPHIELARGLPIPRAAAPDAVAAAAAEAAAADVDLWDHRAPVDLPGSAEEWTGVPISPVVLRPPYARQGRP